MRIEIDGKHPVTRQRQILSQIERRRSFGRATLEIGDGNRLQLFARAAPRLIGKRILRLELGHILAQFVDLAERVGTPAILGKIRLRSLAIQRKLAKIAVRDADHLGRLAGGECS